MPALLVEYVLPVPTPAVSVLPVVEYIAPVPKWSVEVSENSRRSLQRAASRLQQSMCGVSVSRCARDAVP